MPDVLHKRQGERAKRPPLPSPGGACKVQHEPVGELEQPGDAHKEEETSATLVCMTATTISATNRKMKPAANSSVHAAPLLYQHASAEYMMSAASPSNA